jgi:predicted MPP superfamily phosphohydrolase
VRGKTALAATVAAGAGLAWGLFEAQWVACRRLELPVPRLPQQLDGFRILHLSDLHLGSLSLNALALRRAVRWANTLSPDLVVLTGDLLARQRGESVLREALAALPSRHGVFAVLGNVDVSVTRDPFSGGAELTELGDHGTLLSDSAAALDVRGCRVQIVGCAPFSRRRPPARLADADADLRVLLAHFPETVDCLPDAAFDLVLSGHTHGGQICVPSPGGKVRLAGLRPPYDEGVFELPGTTLVVSKGLGTTFVPFRFFARPEVTELVLRRRASGKAESRSLH